MVEKSIKKAKKKLRSASHKILFTPPLPSSNWLIKLADSLLISRWQLEEHSVGITSVQEKEPKGILPTNSPFRSPYRKAFSSQAPTLYSDLPGKFLTSHFIWGKDTRDQRKVSTMRKKRDQNKKKKAIWRRHKWYQEKKYNQQSLSSRGMRKNDVH